MSSGSEDPQDNIDYNPLDLLAAAAVTGTSNLTLTSRHNVTYSVHSAGVVGGMVCNDSPNTGDHVNSMIQPYGGQYSAQDTTLSGVKGHKVVKTPQGKETIYNGVSQAQSPGSGESGDPPSSEQVSLCIHQPEGSQVAVSQGASSGETCTSVINQCQRINRDVSVDKACGKEIKTCSGAIESIPRTGIDSRGTNTQVLDNTGSSEKPLLCGGEREEEKSLCENCGTFDTVHHICGPTEANMAPETGPVDFKISEDYSENSKQVAIDPLTRDASHGTEASTASEGESPDSLGPDRKSHDSELEHPECRSNATAVDFLCDGDFDTRQKDRVSSASSLGTGTSCVKAVTPEDDIQFLSPESKCPISTPVERNSIESVIVQFQLAHSDHCYAGSFNRRQNSVRNHSLESHVSDLSQDSGYGDVHSSPESNQQNEVTDGAGQGEKGSSEGLDSPESQADTLSDCETLSAPSPNYNPEKNLQSLLTMSPGSCSSYQELNEVNKARDALVAIVHSEKPPTLQTTPTKCPSPGPTRQSLGISPKVGGKFKIGTFASVSNSSIGIESPTKLRLSLQNKTLPSKSAKSLLGSFQLPKGHKLSDTDDANRGVVCPPDPYMSNVQHDHDYCLPPEAKSSSPHLMANLLKSTTIPKISLKGSNSSLMVEKTSEEMGLLGKNPRPQQVQVFGDPLDDAVDVSPMVSKHMEGGQPGSKGEGSRLHHGRGRHSKSSVDKTSEYVRSGNSASKLKITGKFQDDYIYFLNTKSRSRRRTSTDTAPVIPPNKIVMPPPKPGDIIVPHLTDADLEAIKQGNHPTIKTSSGNSRLLPSGGVTTGAAVSQMTTMPAMTCTKVATSAPSSISEEENKLINTILSMETEVPKTTVTTSSAPAFPGLIDNSVLPSSSTSTDNLGFNFLSEEINLTAEQMEIIYSAMDEVESMSSDHSPTTPGPDHLVPAPPSSAAAAGTIVTHNPANGDEEPAEAPAGSESKSNPLDAEEVDDGDNDVDLEPCHEASTEVTSCTTLCTDPHQHESHDQKVTEPCVSMANIPATQEASSHFITCGTNSSELLSDSLPVDDAAAAVTSPVPSLSGVSSEEASQDNEAPWIVTVSMYWNDLPAIMIKNLPYIRLVDIHKQMLPAKDTGILKKRCQLLGIVVENCTEMQRYFLVQYGKAFNSKSTLIISKEDAMSLISYYVNPNPKHRTDSERLVEQPNGKRRYIRRHKAGRHRNMHHHQRHRHKEETSPSRVPSPLLHLADDKHEHPDLPDRAPQQPGNGLDPNTQPQVTSGGRPSRRTRHKKINFLEMLRGDTNNNNGEGGDRQRADEDLVDREVSFNPSKRKRDQDGSLSQEKKRPRSKDGTQTFSSEVGLGTDGSYSFPPSSQMPAEILDDSKEAKGDDDHSTVEATKKLKPLRTKKNGVVKVKWSNLFSANKKSRNSAGKVNTQDTADNVNNNYDADRDAAEILRVIHRDRKHMNGHKESIQEGTIYVDLYDSYDSQCVTCTTCRKAFAVESFLKHLHENGNGKLATVVHPQMLMLKDRSPSEQQLRLWKEFQTKRRSLLVPSLTIHAPSCDSKEDIVLTDSRLLGQDTALDNGTSGLSNVNDNHPSTGPDPSHPADPAGGGDQPLSDAPPTGTVCADNPVPVSMGSDHMTTGRRGKVNTGRSDPELSGLVRHSARKRKQKQWYPIENYTSVRKSQVSATDLAAEKLESEQQIPSKKLRLAS